MILKEDAELSRRVIQLKAADAQMLAEFAWLTMQLTNCKPTTKRPTRIGPNRIYNAASNWLIRGLEFAIAFRKKSSPREAALDEAGIEIPFPQRTPTFKEPLLTSVETGGSAGERNRPLPDFRLIVGRPGDYLREECFDARINGCFRYDGCRTKTRKQRNQFLIAD